ncbi:MAG: hypothetical protein WCJ64_05370 [Rhodospirillaceae bacterium]
MTYKNLRTLGVGFVLCLASGTAMADMVVVKATGPGLKTGQVVTTGVSITLPAASKAVLLTRDGRTVQLNGPFEGPVPEPAAAAGGDNKTVSALSRLLTASAADSSALGVTRAGDFSSPYTISVKGGSHCQVASEKPRFQREIGSPEEHLTITTASGASQTLTWPEDEAELGWPTSVPFDAGSYTLHLNTQPDTGRLVVHLIPAEVKGSAALAVWMADHGCSAQALKLLASLR